MAKTPGNCSSSANYFLIFTLLVFFMLLYVYINPSYIMSAKKERFIANATYDAKLMPADKIVVMQGLGNPDIPVQATDVDTTDESSPSVDGKPNGPRSKLVFAYNKCKPECCATSGGYSCNGGCPCITKDQIKFISTRGFNHKNDKCSFDEMDF